MTSLAQLLEYRKKLNANSTRAEQRLVGRLRKAGFRVRAQIIVAPFIVDILIPRKMLIIEVDGPIHNSDLAKRYDESRTAYLTQCGFTVLRVRNDDVGKQAVINKVASYPDVLVKR